MTQSTLDNVFARWARVGVLSGGRAARRSPDLERLLLDTARVSPQSARLFGAAVSWLVVFDGYIARHRLKRLAIDELEPPRRPALGLLLDLAIEHGASRELNVAARACGRAAQPRVLFDVHRGDAARQRLARRTACPAALERGLWAPSVEPRRDALRPASWILRHNPDYGDRVVRKGDLRATILETLRWDAPGGVLESEQALVKLCAANRPAVRAALDDLEREGIALRQADGPDRRRRRIGVAPGGLGNMSDRVRAQLSEDQAKLAGGRSACRSAGRAVL